MNAAYNYYATLAIAICKGEVKKLNRIWADTMSLSFDEIDYTFYRGTEDQNPDPFMLSIYVINRRRGKYASLQRNILYSHQEFSSSGL
ncbi:hypothetical protein [Wolbachia endosymbiont of Tettigetta isshikii]|uniref:hypothetical protein n=1 Tax=Wolbachia endosymbiont of Tettigetta isshikii TaxID=3239093 RepID=UPI0039811362